jgi:hypothetical protein
MLHDVVSQQSMLPRVCRFQTQSLSVLTTEKMAWLTTQLKAHVRLRRAVLMQMEVHVVKLLRLRPVHRSLRQEYFVRMIVTMVWFRIHKRCPAKKLHAQSSQMLLVVVRQLQMRQSVAQYHQQVLSVPRLAAVD